MGDLSAQLKGLIGKTVTEEDMQDLAVAIADALDAAPPPERVLPEGFEKFECPRCNGKGYFRFDWSGRCEACDGTGWRLRRAALSPHSGADPEPPCCTGVAATWCPVHGDCTCPRVIDPDPDGDWWSENPTCPLHGMSSSHADPEPQRVIVDFAEVEPQHSPLRTWPADPEAGE